MPTNDWIGDLCHAAVDNRCCAREMRMPASSAKRSFFQISANGCLEPKPTDSAECMNGKNPLQSSLLGALIRSGRSINISPKCRRSRRSIDSRENLCCKSSCVLVRIDGGSEHDLRVWKLGQVLVHTNGLGTICNAAER